MLTDARTLAPGSVIRADICIIGAGAAGITLALELANSGLRTVMLESGGADGPDPATQALYEGESVGQPMQSLADPLGLDVIRLRWLGGTTNHWAGFCRPIERIDFERRDHLAVSGWPLDGGDLASFWARAARYCRISDADDDADTWATRTGLSPPLPTAGAVRTFAYQVTPEMSFGAEYHDDLAADDSLEVLLWANAVNLATSGGTRLDAVDIATLSGTTARVEADAIVLACGGLENPRLLLASTDADPAGVANGHDQVGRYFAEHFQVAGGFGVLDVDQSLLDGYNGTNVTLSEGRFAGQQHGVKFALGLSSNHVRDAATLGLEAQLISGSLPVGVPLRLSGVGVIDAAELMALTGDRAPATSIYVQLLAEQQLDPESRVTLGKGTDALGMRRIRLDWRYGAEDRAAVVRGMQTMGEELGAAGLGRLQVLPGAVTIEPENIVADEFITIYGADVNAIDPEDFPIGVGFHHMCTTRMSDDPATGVVDVQCRAHDVDNLWIAGSSVFGTGGVSTPTLTIVALAIRLADHLKEVLR